MRRLHFPVIVPALLALAAWGTAPVMMAADAPKTEPKVAPKTTVIAGVDAATPESAVLMPVRILRANDFRGIYDLLSPEEKAKAAADWKKAQDQAKSGAKENDVNQLNDLLAKMLSPTAVDDLFKEAEPKLATLNPQETSQALQMAAGFLPMMLNQAQPGQTPEQTKNKQALSAMLQGMLTDASGWVLTAGINDPKKLRAAIESLVAGAKALGVKNAAELQALPFEDFIGRLGPIVKQAKLAAGVYDIGIDAFLDSVKATATPAAAGAPAAERALSVSFAAFGKPYTFPVTVVQKDGHWIISPKNGDQFGAMKQMIPGGMPMGGEGEGADAGGMK